MTPAAFIPRLEGAPSPIWDRLHPAAVALLEDRGIRLEPTLLGRLASAGCRVDSAQGVARIPSGLVEQALARAPREVHLAGRRRGHEFVLGGDRLHFALGSPVAAPPGPDVVRLADALPEVDIVYAGSDEPGLGHLAAAWRETGKHLRLRVSRPALAGLLADIAEVVTEARPASDRGAVISAAFLAAGTRAMPAAIALAERGIPIVVCLGDAAAAANADPRPVDAHALFLAWLVALQSAHPGAPVILGLPSSFPLYGALAAATGGQAEWPSSPSSPLWPSEGPEGQAEWPSSPSSPLWPSEGPEGQAEWPSSPSSPLWPSEGPEGQAEWLPSPSSPLWPSEGPGGQAEWPSSPSSPLWPSEATGGIEGGPGSSPRLPLPFTVTALSTAMPRLGPTAGWQGSGPGTLAALAGAAELAGMGLLGGGQAATAAKLLHDADVARGLARLMRGVDLDEAHLMAGAIDRVGPHGHYLLERETRQFMRAEVAPRRLRDERSPSEWLADARDDEGRLASEAARLLSTHEPSAWPSGADAAVAALVAQASRLVSE